VFNRSGNPYPVAQRVDWNTMKQLGQILTDRGSKYAVSGMPVQSRADIDAALKSLLRTKSYAKATHNTWGAVLSQSGALKADDGESGAGMVILRMLEREDLRDHLIVVTRWYGGKHLGGDRFRHVQTCVRMYLEAL
jgi:putative IMPACT (imprinted ancient) family translation regulator